MIVESKLKELEAYNLDLVRDHSRERYRQRKTFIVLDGLNIGFELNRRNYSIRFFLYRDKKRKRLFQTEFIKLEYSCDALKFALFGMISEYYESIGKSPHLPMYCEMELSVPVAHLFYLYNNGELERALKREEVR